MAGLKIGDCCYQHGLRHETSREPPHDEVICRADRFIVLSQSEIGPGEVRIGLSKVNGIPRNLLECLDRGIQLSEVIIGTRDKNFGGITIRLGRLFLATHGLEELCPRRDHDRVVILSSRE